MAATDEPEAVAGPRRRLRLGWGLLRDWRPTWTRVRSLARSGLTLFVVLTATLWLLPGVSATGLVSMLWLVVLVAGIGVVLRPVMVAAAVALGGVGGLTLGVCVQAIVMYVALRLDPGAHVSHFAWAFAASWVSAVLSTLLNWLLDAGTDDAFLGETLRQMSRTRRRTGGPREPGVLVIQLDGVSAPLLDWAVKAGNLPNLGRWLRTGEHRMTGWHTGVPATTPAVQAGILHGNGSQVPAFRWYEKGARRLVVCNRPRDAALVEQRLSNGRGLLADGGVSISNVFSGDAPISLLTVSSAALPGRSARGYAAFLASPYGLTRGIVRGVGELITEIHQARLQRRRDVRPRVVRGGGYALLRAVTNVLLRDLNVSLIAEQMARGAPVIFCDFVDYDEVAHHAGPARPEALKALEGLDRVLGTVRRLSAEAARRYHIVVLSDHGQSQGETFRQRYGQAIEEVVHHLATRHRAVAQHSVDAQHFVDTQHSVDTQPRAAAGHRPDTEPRPVGEASNAVRIGTSTAATGTVEQWGPVNVLLTHVSGDRGATAAAARKLATDGEVALGPAGAEARAAGGADVDLVVIASGNLGMVYLTDHPGKLSRERLDEAYPGLVEALAGHAGIGVVVVGTEQHGPVAVGKDGEHRLTDGEVTGQDPLRQYGPGAAADLLRHQGMAHVGDLVLISSIDGRTDEVAAFEELVGSHGGLGGPQTEAVLLYPSSWRITEERLSDPVAVYRQLIKWLEHLGVRLPGTDQESAVAGAGTAVRAVAGAGAAEAINAASARTPGAAPLDGEALDAETVTSARA